MNQSSTHHLLTLPPEIREEVYRLLLHPTANQCYHDDEYTTYDYAPSMAVFQLNKQIYYEARKIFRDLNIFVRIETPWPEAQQHVCASEMQVLEFLLTITQVEMEGHTPILVKGKKAANFINHSLVVSIDAPRHPMPDVDIKYFVILLDDLTNFTRMWFYSSLTHPRLNEHLRLVLSLRDPFRPSWEEKRVPKQIQQKLILPFGEVKNLYATEFGGDIKPFSAVEKELRALQAQPPASPESCLSEAMRLKAEGNTELKSGNYDKALGFYRLAWGAIHVVIKGRQRHIHGDAFFSRELQEEPFKGKNGQSERLLLRVQLVANTCQTYLKMGNYEECKHWGMRSISMLREAMGADDHQGFNPQDEAVTGFLGADQLGKIYYRTALAFKELGDESEARRLLRVAEIYLPRDESVKKAVAATSLKLG